MSEEKNCMQHKCNRKLMGKKGKKYPAHQIAGQKYSWWPEIPPPPQELNGRPVNEALLFCYITFKIRQSFFDIKEFLKNLLHIMDLCFRLSLKKYYWQQCLTIKTYLELITIRSKDYLQFTSTKHSFQLIMTIKITVIMIISIIIIIISCYSNGYIGDLPGVFSVWYFPRHILALS